MYEGVDTLRPRFHFTAPSGWINDPNGLIWHAGEFHLFYQHLWPRHWGHASSPDLIHWSHHPIALFPGPEGDIWSGSTHADPADPSRLLAFYTLYQGGVQTQGMATSLDGGLTWEPSAENPILVDPGAKDFRDPKVFWHDPSSSWVMVLAAGQELRVYTAQHLTDWTLASTFGAGQLGDGQVWECPDLFPMQAPYGSTVWVLLASNFSPGGVVWLGDFDGQQFVPRGPSRQFSGGMDDYAAITWAAPGGRRIALGWMNSWTYAEAMTGAAWQGQMTLPRELFLRDSGELELLQWPPQEVLAQIQPIPLAEGEAVEVPTSTGVVRVGFEEAIWIDRSEVDRRGLPEAFCHRIEAPARPGRAMVVVDQFSVEVFAGDGLVYLAATLPPWSPASPPR